MNILDTGIAFADENMRMDEKLLEELDPKGEALIHFYGWKGLCATYGYFIKPEQWVDLEKARFKKLSLSRRPTGGGIIFHIWDLAFSFLMPSGHPAFSINTLENYRFVNQVVLEVMQDLFDLTGSELYRETLYDAPSGLVDLQGCPENPSNSPDLTTRGIHCPANAESLGPDCTHFCMAKPTQYDVVYKGLKIAGAAQRRRKQGYLHQGTISLAFPDIGLLKEILLSKDEVVRAMQSYTFAPLGRNCSEEELNKTRREIQSRLQQKFIEKLHGMVYSGFSTQIEKPYVAKK